MKNLKISTRLSSAFALLVLMLVGLAAAAITQLAAMRAATAEITDNWLPSVEVVAAIAEQAALNRIFIARHVMNTDDSAIAKIDQEVAAARAKFGELRKVYEPLISSPDEKRTYEDFGAAWKKYVEVNDKVFSSEANMPSWRAKTSRESRSGAEAQPWPSSAVNAVIAVTAKSL